MTPFVEPSKDRVPLNATQIREATKQYDDAVAGVEKSEARGSGAVSVYWRRRLVRGTLRRAGQPGVDEVGNDGFSRKAAELAPDAPFVLTLLALDDAMSEPDASGSRHVDAYERLSNSAQENVDAGKHLSEDKNKALWADLAVSGVQTSEDQQHVVGVLIGGGTVAAKRADSYISRQLARSIMMGELGKGEKPAVSKLAAEIASQREQMTKEIRGKYGD